MRWFLRSVTRIFTLLIITLASVSLFLLLFFPSYLGALIEWLKDIVITLGWKNYLFAALVSLIESLPFINMAFPWIIIIVMISGFVAQTDYRGIAAVIIVFIIIGDSIAYLLGSRKWQKLLAEYGNIVWLTPERLEKVKTIIKKYDNLTIFASKRSNYTRGIIPFFSWLSHTKRWSFTLWNALGAIIYGWVVVWLAKFFLWNYALVLPYIRIIAIVIIVWTILWYLIHYYVKKRKNRQIHS